MEDPSLAKRAFLKIVVASAGVLVLVWYCLGPLLRQGPSFFLFV